MSDERYLKPFLGRGAGRPTDIQRVERQLARLNARCANDPEFKTQSEPVRKVLQSILDDLRAKGK